MAACAKLSCKGKAKRGDIFCPAHHPEPPVTGGDSSPPLMTTLFTEEEQAMIAKFGAIGDLSGAIESLRLLLARNLHEDNRSGAVAAANALVRAEVAHHRISGQQASTLLTALDTVLAELGVGGEV